MVQLKSVRRYLTVLCLLLCTLLSGCVDYDLGIRFDSQTHGTLTQTVHLSDRLLTLSDTGTRQIFQQFTAKAEALSGQIRQLDEDTLQITLPFYSGAQLVERFNALYSGDFYDGDSSLSDLSTSLLTLPGAPTVSAHLDLQQRNYIFALRNHLTYDLQIAPTQTLPVSSQRRVGEATLREPRSWLTLDFHLTTPWGLTSTDFSSTAPSTTPPPSTQGHSATWHLEAERPQHIEATFWVPSPIGIGGGAIALFCLLGYTLRYKLLPPPK